MQPEDAIANWPNWQIQPPCKPEIVAHIGRGLSNQNYLLRAGETQMVLRINASESYLPGIDRQREAQVWRKACQAGIAPQPIHTEQAYFVSEFVAGESLSDTAPPLDIIHKALKLIRQCHGLECDVAPIDYAARIQLYWDLIAKNGTKVEESLVRQRPAMLRHLQFLLDAQSSRVLCHHDPVKANFVGTTENLFLIDWEYAQQGLAAMDFAAFATEWGVADKLVLESSGIELEVLQQAKILYRYLCDLWATARN